MSSSTSEQQYSSSFSETKSYYTTSKNWPPDKYGGSGDSVADSIESSRGFKPSDVNDPHKREFLTSLTQKVFKVGVDENTPPSKPIDLEKIFTPAEGEQIKPKKNKKLFASSAFYEKGFHPTVEDQVELAKRISQSLSDISNKSSKGQSMFVNRKKRSVKWVHEGEGKAEAKESETRCSDSKKDILHLVRNPCGQLLDINVARRQGHNFEPALSPQVCQKIVEDLNAPKGKAFELFWQQVLKNNIV
ncbi:unnamed protein product [Acanthoscelides obtectus]|uniref:Uncharacterized protein n=2 Tax=Acanthoscelides obtectus TaxID=200917 RepID=A0A9P0P2T2_ACAOB|nr:unnamed protein product [Acanthoscelides obtectus]CAK1666478.1 hypothetical protein AOBTE_LOCUS25345 [Acanthoscelides obtectus]